MQLLNIKLLLLSILAFTYGIKMTLV